MPRIAELSLDGRPELLIDSGRDYVPLAEPGVAA